MTDIDTAEAGDPIDDDAVIHPDAEPEDGAGDDGSDIADPEDTEA